jgi:hypothetical protein
MDILLKAPVHFIEIRSKSGRLICRMDLKRGLLEWKEGKDYDLIDLARLAHDQLDLLSPSDEQET